IGTTRWCVRRSQVGGEPGALIDRPLGIEFGGQLGPSDQVGADTAGTQLVVQSPVRLLPSAQNHIVDSQQALVTAMDEMQSFVVVALSLWTVYHVLSAMLQVAAVDPTGRPAQACTQLGGLPLEKGHRACRPRMCRGGQAAGCRRVAADAPRIQEGRDVPGRVG